MPFSIPVAPDLLLTETRRTDRERFVEYFRDKEIYDNTLLIPYPYHLSDADEWIALNESWEKAHPQPMHFAIRDGSGLLLGGCDFIGLEPGVHYKSEIGYWLAKRFWGRGIMPAVVGKLCEIGFEKFGLQRITATTFLHNERSGRVLEKSGFVYEGTLRNYYRKAGQILDAKLYAKIP
jgi:RimJ/RimL family protein N-acetyltransferase